MPLPEAIPFPYYVNLYAIRSRSVPSLSWEINILGGRAEGIRGREHVVVGTFYHLQSSSRPHDVFNATIAIEYV